MNLCYARAYSQLAKYLLGLSFFWLKFNAHINIIVTRKIQSIVLKLIPFIVLKKIKDEKSFLNKILQKYPTL
jgi:hypothetical protein